jgi:hypothetical protein
MVAKCPVCGSHERGTTSHGVCHGSARVERLEKLVRDLAKLCGTTVEEMIERQKLIDSGG